LIAPPLLDPAEPVAAPADPAGGEAAAPPDSAGPAEAAGASAELVDDESPFFVQAAIDSAVAKATARTADRRTVSFIADFLLGFLDDSRPGWD